jgi:hypothetical protein
MPDYLKFFPKPLLEDIARGHCLPVLGAGFSKNANIPAGKSLPLWDDLGKVLAADLEEYSFRGALDAISAYTHTYTRAKLTERLTELLLIGEATPGPAHRAFAQLPFDIVCTTNFDFLLERGYDDIRRCVPVVNEGQLSIAAPANAVRLLKLHGDIGDPERMIATEEDYDAFLSRYPLIGTYLANLLISRTPLFIGYSLDDPDFRHFWQVIKDRLGNLRRHAYALAVQASRQDAGRYERRGVKLIELPGRAADYGAILADVFAQLKDYSGEHAFAGSTASSEDVQADLQLPKDASRLCFFSVPRSTQAIYREHVFPIAQRYGFTPTTADDVLTFGDAIAAKIDALIERADVIVVDATSPVTRKEMDYAVARRGSNRRIILIIDDASRVPSDIAQYVYLVRPKTTDTGFAVFLENIERIFADYAGEVASKLADEPERLLQAHAYNAALVATISALEIALRNCVGPPGDRTPLSQLVRTASQQHIISAEEASFILSECLRVRNGILHEGLQLSGVLARNLVKQALPIAARLRNSAKTAIRSVPADEPRPADTGNGAKSRSKHRRTS